jgi:phosphatase NudJ
MRVVGCFLFHEDKFVLVHRLPHKPEGGTWGLASGKVEEGESDLAAIQRELFEETGYKAGDHEVELLGAFDFTTPDGEPYVFVAHRVQLDEHHDVIIEKAAHSEFQWVTIEEADARDDLIYGLHDLFRYVGLID